jgi:hypothetical protein
MPAGGFLLAVVQKDSDAMAAQIPGQDQVGLTVTSSTITTVHTAAGS